MATRNPDLVRVNLKIKKGTHRLFRVWCLENGRTLQDGLEHAVLLLMKSQVGAGAVAGMAPTQTPGVLNSGGNAPRTFSPSTIRMANALGVPLAGAAPVAAGPPPTDPEPNADADDSNAIVPDEGTVSSWWDTPEGQALKRERAEIEATMAKEAEEARAAAELEDHDWLLDRPTAAAPSAESDPDDEYDMPTVAPDARAPAGSPAREAWEWGEYCVEVEDVSLTEFRRRQSAGPPPAKSNGHANGHAQGPITAKEYDVPAGWVDAEGSTRAQNLKRYGEDEDVEYWPPVRESGLEVDAPIDLAAIAPTRRGN